MALYPLPPKDAPARQMHLERDPNRKFHNWFNMESSAWHQASWLKVPPHLVSRTYPTPCLYLLDSFDGKIIHKGQTSLFWCHHCLIMHPLWVAGWDAWSPIFPMPLLFHGLEGIISKNSLLLAYHNLAEVTPMGSFYLQEAKRVHSHPLQDGPLNSSVLYMVWTK